MDKVFFGIKEEDEIIWRFCRTFVIHNSSSSNGSNKGKKNKK